MATRKRPQGKAQGPSIGGGWVGGKPGAGSIPGGLAPITPQNPYRSGQPPAPPPAPPAGPPVDPYLERAKAQAANAMRLGDAWDTYSTGVTQADYGFNAQGGIDQSTPYSRAKLLEDSYKRGQRANTDTYAGMGQLYSGAYGVEQNYGARNYDIGIDQLKKGLGSALDTTLKGRLDRYSTYGADLDQQSLESLIAALSKGRGT
jgi:hypothetical protein